MFKIDSLQNDFTSFKNRLDPVIEDTLELLKKVNRVAEKVETNIDTLKTSVDKVKKTADSIVDFVVKVKGKVEPSIMDTVTAYTAMVKGVSTFFDKLKSTKRTYKSYRNDDNLLFDEAFEPVTSSPLSIDKEEFNFDNQFNDINKELNEVRKKLEEMKKV